MFAKMASSGSRFFINLSCDSSPQGGLDWQMTLPSACAGNLNAGL